MKLTDALIQVESGGNDYAIGDLHLKQKAYGCLQIRKPCLDDVNRANGTSFEPTQMLGNRSLSLWVFHEYMKLYATKERLGREPTDEDHARIWNGGPMGWKRNATLRYWKKVKARLGIMTRSEYLAELTNPTPSLVLKPWPIGNIVQGWAENPHLYASVYTDPANLHRELGGHHGTDIQGPRRTPVVAAQEGTVFHIATDRSAIGGISVWTSSPDLLNGKDKINIRLVYAHLDESAVKPGDYVKKGQLIGYMGNTGVQTGTVQPYWKAPALDNTHLHFGADEHIWRDAQWVIRHPGPAGGSFDVMAYLSGDLSYMRTFIQRITSYIERFKGRH